MINIIKEDSDKQIVLKNWGCEYVLHNRLDYCAKLLSFHKGGKFSLHYHVMKTETWYVAKGSFELIYIDPETADRHSVMLETGNIIEIPKGHAHQLIALEDSLIFEASTMHYDYDSYRVEKGDSQKC